jgi:hypothetical protein
LKVDRKSSVHGQNGAIDPSRTFRLINIDLEIPMPAVRLVHGLRQFALSSSNHYHPPTGYCDVARKIVKRATSIAKTKKPNEHGEFNRQPHNKNIVRETGTMKQSTSLKAAAFVCAMTTLPHMAAAQTAPAIPPILVTPDTIDTRIGKLEFKDGAPSAETAAKVYDTLDFTRGLDAFLNSYGGASAYAIRKGLLGIGAEDNTVTIYSELMDSKSLSCGLGGSSTLASRAPIAAKAENTSSCHRTMTGQFRMVAFT